MKRATRSVSPLTLNMNKFLYNIFRALQKEFLLSSFFLKQIVFNTFFFFVLLFY